MESIYLPKYLPLGSWSESARSYGNGIMEDDLYTGLEGKTLPEIIED